MKIIENIPNFLYEEGKIQNICECYCRDSELLDDLIQETYLILTNLDQDDLKEFYQDGRLIYYVMGIVKNQWFSSTSPFYKKFKKFDRITKTIQND